MEGLIAYYFLSTRECMCVRARIKQRQICKLLHQKDICMCVRARAHANNPCIYTHRDTYPQTVGKNSKRIC